MSSPSNVDDIGIETPATKVRTRADLYRYIHDNGADLVYVFNTIVASSLNLLDDQLERNEDQVLEIGASNDDDKDVIRFYEDRSADASPSWSLRLGARDGDTQVGFEIAERSQLGLFIQKDTGNVGLGSRNPEHRLHVGGALKVTGGAIIDALLEASGGITVPKDKPVTVGTIEATGTVTAAGGLVVADGHTLQVDGTLAAKGAIQANGGLSIPGGQSLTLEGLLALKGGLSVGLTASAANGVLVGAAERLRIVRGGVRIVDGKLEPIGVGFTVSQAQVSNWWAIHIQYDAPFSGQPSVTVQIVGERSSLVHNAVVSTVKDQEKDAVHVTIGDSNGNVVLQPFDFIIIGPA